VRIPRDSSGSTPNDAGLFLLLIRYRICETRGYSRRVHKGYPLQGKHRADVIRTDGTIRADLGLWISFFPKRDNGARTPVQVWPPRCRMQILLLAGAPRQTSGNMNHAASRRDERPRCLVTGNPSLSARSRGFEQSPNGPLASRAPPLEFFRSIVRVLRATKAWEPMSSLRRNLDR